MTLFICIAAFFAAYVITIKAIEAFDNRRFKKQKARINALVEETKNKDTNNQGLRRSGDLEPDSVPKGEGSMCNHLRGG